MDGPDLAAEIRIARTAGSVWVGFGEASQNSAEVVAGEFGLDTDPENYHEIYRDEALLLLTLILRQDLAYGAAIMASSEANELAGRFLAAFDDGHRFFTNGQFHLRALSPMKALSWASVTDATFGTGVLVVGRSTGCLWVEDED